MLGFIKKVVTGRIFKKVADSAVVGGIVGGGAVVTQDMAAGEADPILVAVLALSTAIARFVYVMWLKKG